VVPTVSVKKKAVSITSFCAFRSDGPMVCRPRRHQTVKRDLTLKVQNMNWQMTDLAMLFVVRL